MKMTPEFASRLQAILKGWSEVDKAKPDTLTDAQVEAKRDGIIGFLNRLPIEAQKPDAPSILVEATAFIAWANEHHAEHHHRETMLQMMLATSNTKAH